MTLKHLKHFLAFKENNVGILKLIALPKLIAIKDAKKPVNTLSNAKSFLLF